MAAPGAEQGTVAGMGTLEDLRELIVVGHVAWKPHPRAKDLDDWHHYDMPLAGTFTVDGAAVLFECIGFDPRPSAAWRYTFLPPDLDESVFEDVFELRAALEKVFAAQPTVVAEGADAVLTRIQPVG